MNGITAADTHLWELTAILDLVPRQPLQDVVSAMLLAHQFGRTIHVLDDTMQLMERFLVVANRTYIKDMLRTLSWTLWRLDQHGNAVAHASHKQAQPTPFADSLHHGDVFIAISANDTQPYVAEVVRTASVYGAITVGVTTTHDSTLMTLTDHCITLPTEERDYLTDVLFVLCHAICRELHQRIVAAQNPSAAGNTATTRTFPARHPAKENKPQASAGNAPDNMRERDKLGG